jgi:tribbles homolog 1/2
MSNTPNSTLPLPTILTRDKPNVPTSSSSPLSSIFMLNGTPPPQVQPVKKCIFHRQCCRNHQVISANQQQQQDLQKRIIGGVASGTCTQATVATTTGGNRTPYTRDAISTNVQPQHNASLIADRYLLMDLVEGSSMYKCVDIRTQEELVCKVRPFAI